MNCTSKIRKQCLFLSRLLDCAPCCIALSRIHLQTKQESLVPQTCVFYWKTCVSLLSRDRHAYVCMCLIISKWIYCLHRVFFNIDQPTNRPGLGVYITFHCLCFHLLPVYHSFLGFFILYLCVGSFLLQRFFVCLLETPDLLNSFSKIISVHYDLFFQFHLVQIIPISRNIRTLFFVA